MGVKYEVSATVGEYTDKEGKQRKNYVRMGVIMDTKNGGLMLKLEAIPVGWDGFAWLNEPKEREYRTAGGGKQEPRDQFNPDEDIPFMNLNNPRSFDTSIG